MDLSAVEKKIEYTFKNKELLKRALTLSSFDYRHSNESLEFFGDAILEFIVSEKIFGIDVDEGELTETRKTLVCDKSLAQVSKKLGLDGFLIKGEGDTRNKKAIPSVYEAVTAAIYLDGGMPSAKKFVLNTLDFSFDAAEKNYKGELQEALQGSGHECPKYHTLDIGSPQTPVFQAKVTVFNSTFTGLGGSKQKAEQDAAKKALKKVKK